MDFAAAPEAEQVARLAELARRALGSWDLAGAGVDLIKYRENAVFQVTEGSGGKHVLRVHRPGYRTDAHIRSEVEWMRALSSSGIPTPEAMTTTSGAISVVAEAEGVPEPRQCDLLAWVDGAPLGTLERGVDLEGKALRRSYETLGEIAARIHAHGESWKKPAGFARPAWNTDALVGESPTFGRFWELNAVTSAQREVLFRARDRARERLGDLGPASLLIHGDLIPDNLLVGPGGARIIDFDDCGWSWCAFELVTSVFPLLVSGGFDAGLAGYLEGYRRVRGFPESELAFVPDLLAARALSYLGWPAGRPEIHSQRELAPLIAAAVTDLAEEYLAGQLGGVSRDS